MRKDYYKQEYGKILFVFFGPVEKQKIGLHQLPITIARQKCEKNCICLPNRFPKFHVSKENKCKKNSVHRRIKIAIEFFSSLLTKREPWRATKPNHSSILVFHEISLRIPFPQKETVIFWLKN